MSISCYYYYTRDWIVKENALSYFINEYSSLQSDTKNHLCTTSELYMINRKSCDVNNIKIMKSHKKYPYLP